MQIMEFPERSYAAVRKAPVEERTRPTVGDIVLYVLSDGRNAGQVRPAIVVQPWSSMMVNLRVFTDGANDYPLSDPNGVLWRTSVPYSENKEPGTWHWRNGE